ncbi:unnamed protein product [Lota lota]
MSLFVQEWSGGGSSPTEALLYGARPRNPRPRKKFQHTARTPQLKSTAIGNAVLQFQRSSLGCKEGVKDKENARTRHSQNFTEYMVKGEVPRRGMRALYNLDKLQAFLNHLDLFHRGTSKLSSVQVGQILKDVVTHRQAIKRKKSRALKECSTPSDLDMVYGYVAGYLAIVSGHRPVVCTSMKIKDIVDAERKGDRFVLWRDGKPVAKLNQYLTSAWRDAGLEGEINFNMVRSTWFHTYPQFQGVHCDNTIKKSTTSASCFFPNSWALPFLPSPKKMFQHTARTPQLNRTVVGKALLQFQKASLGCKSRPKDVDNARTRRCHAIRFCAYMSKGEVPKQHTLTAGNQKAFLEAAKNEIPKLLKKLQAACTHSHLELVYGYICGYLAIVSGHRPVVFTSMRMLEIIDAEYKDEKYVVWVKDHKTQKSFGHATLPMYAEEYQWLRDVADVVHGLFPESDLVFVRRDGKPVNKLNQLLRNAWKHAGLSGDITFSMVRSSVSTQKHLTAEERSRVATSMCHDVATAEKFYCPVPELADAFQVRHLRMKALVEGVDDMEEEEEEEDTAEEEGLVVYDDSPDTSSPPTPSHALVYSESDDDDDDDNSQPQPSTSALQSAGEEAAQPGSRSTTSCRRLSFDIDADVPQVPTPSTSVTKDLVIKLKRLP